MLARQIVGGAPSNLNGWSGKYDSCSKRGLGRDKAMQGAQPSPAAQSVSKTLHSACLPADRLAAPSQALGKWAVTDLESCCWIPALPCHQSRLILCGTWRHRQPAQLTLSSEACLVAFCAVTHHAFPPLTLLCLFCLVLLIKILPRRGKDVSG